MSIYIYRKSDALVRWRSLIYSSPELAARFDPDITTHIRNM